MFSLLRWWDDSPCGRRACDDWSFTFSEAGTPMDTFVLFDAAALATPYLVSTDWPAIPVFDLIGRFLNYRLAFDEGRVLQLLMAKPPADWRLETKRSALRERLLSIPAWLPFLELLCLLIFEPFRPP